MSNLRNNVLLVVAGAVLAYTLYNGYYYLQVLRWVDGIRISQAVQQAAQQAQRAPQTAPTPPPAK